MSKERVYKGTPVIGVLGFVPWARGAAMFGRIYLRNTIWKDYLSGKPEPETLFVLAHEYTHTKRLGKNIKPHIIFWLNRKFRFQEELAAIREEMKVLKKYKKEFDIEKRAKHLSGLTYFWCTDYQTARAELKAIWTQVK